MKKILIILGCICVIAISTNAQSVGCGSSCTDKTSKVDNCIDKQETVKAGDKVETTTTTTVTDGKEKVEKTVVVTKGENKEGCSENSSCCEDKSESHVTKEVKKVETKKK